MKHTSNIYTIGSFTIDSNEPKNYGGPNVALRFCVCQQIFCVRDTACQQFFCVCSSSAVQVQFRMCVGCSTNLILSDFQEFYMFCSHSYGVPSLLRPLCCLFRLSLRFPLIVLFLYLAILHTRAGTQHRNLPGLKNALYWELENRIGGLPYFVFNIFCNIFVVFMYYTSSMLNKNDPCSFQILQYFTPPGYFTIIDVAYMQYS